MAQQDPRPILGYNKVFRIEQYWVYTSVIVWNPFVWKVWSIFLDKRRKLTPGRKRRGMSPKWFNGKPLDSHLLHVGSWRDCKSLSFRAPPTGIFSPRTPCFCSSPAPYSLLPHQHPKGHCVRRGNLEWHLCICDVFPFQFNKNPLGSGSYHDPVNELFHSFL